MTLDSRAQFDASLDLLPEPLRTRAVGLRRYVTTAGRYDPIAEAVSLAFDAAYAGDQTAAEKMLRLAESLVDARGIPGRPKPRVPPWKTVARGIRGYVPLPGRPARQEPVLVATDASFKQRHAGWGYVASDGHWGCRGMPIGGRLDPTGQSGAMISELRAVNMVLCDIKGQFTLLLDSAAAIRYLTLWQAGQVSRMPEGYSLRPRMTKDGATGTPTLVRLAASVAARSDLDIRHVHGHAGHALNEAADGLAHFARRCMAGDQDGDEAALTARASGLVAAFLRDWYDGLG